MRGRVASLETASDFNVLSRIARDLCLAVGRLDCVPAPVVPRDRRLRHCRARVLRGHALALPCVGEWLGRLCPACEQP